MTHDDPRYAGIVDRLAATYEGTFSRETVADLVRRTRDLLMGTRTGPTLLPLQVERFAHGRLVAVAQLDGRLAKEVPRVLFLCVHNSGRSQMAAAFANRLGRGRLEAVSAGSDPGPRVNEHVVAALRERDIDISDEFPKPLTDEMVDASDVVVTMGCGDVCPVRPGRRYVDWDIEDPSTVSPERVREIRDEVQRRVRDLVEELVPQAST